jgi:hypothetical protein
MAFLLRRDQNAQQQANELAARLGRLEAESPSQSALKLGDHGLITDEALAEPLALASRCRRSRQRESPLYGGFPFGRCVARTRDPLLVRQVLSQLS